MTEQDGGGDTSMEGHDNYHAKQGLEQGEVRLLANVIHENWCGGCTYGPAVEEMRAAEAVLRHQQ